MPRRAPLVLVVLAALVVAFSADAAPDSGASGGGSAPFPPGHPFFGDRLDIDLTARAHESTARGRFTLTHLRGTGGLAGQVAGSVECVAVVGAEARVTGVISRGHVPEFAGQSVDPVGHTVALTIFDNGEDDLVLFDISFFPPHPIVGCGPGVTPFVIDRGNFTVSG